MPIRVGILAEGNDHLILALFLAKLLDVAEEEIETDVIDGWGHGWGYVFSSVDLALRRFYHRCARLAILSVDNDGNIDLQATGQQEDPRHPRHWLHDAETSHPNCRWCQLRGLSELARDQLNWIKNKPGRYWPILVAVPVETIEAWLLATHAILVEGEGSAHAERERRAHFKQRLYGLPVASLESVQTIALPMIRRLSLAQIQILREHSQSFDDFASQVDQALEEIETAPDCWT